MRKFLLWIFIKIPLGILGIAVATQLVAMLIPPIYNFEKTKPFSGPNWHNPYQKCSTLPQWNANFHAHTNAWGPMTNGRDNAPHEVYSAYKKMGFQIVGLSDYQSINPLRSRQPDYIPIYEHGYNAKKAHQQSIGAEKPWAFDVMFMQSVHVKQFIIDGLKKRSQLVSLNHPSKWGGYSNEELSLLSNYDLFEVLNHYGSSETAWDVVLSSGKLAYIIGNDDAHNVEKIEEVGRCFTRVLAPNKSRESVINALSKGQAYGVDMPVLNGETHTLKAFRIACLPKVLLYEIQKDTLKIMLSQAAVQLDLIGQNGEKLAQMQGDTIQIPLRNYKSSYLRTRISWPDGLCYYMNPIVKFNKEVPTNAVRYSVSIFKTWGIRLLALALTIMAVVLLRQMRTPRKRELNPRW